MLVHATCIDLDGLGVLLRGPSGSGKSDLALRLLDGGAQLVSDDQTRLEVQAGRLLASPPPTIAGLLEVRGIGIVPMPHVSQVAVGLVVDLLPLDRIERLPDPQSLDILGIRLPCIALYALEASAPLKVRLAVRCVTSDN